MDNNQLILWVCKESVLYCASYSQHGENENEGEQDELCVEQDVPFIVFECQRVTCEYLVDQ